jgi:serine/threonine protein kinase/tetratricopeptide (TPR) repeat protein
MRPALFDRLAVGLAERYRLEEEIGAGGMAIVYSARDLKLNRRVALKVLRPELSASLGTERFLREIRLAAGLQHPHIVAVHDCGECDDLLYYVMPLVEGETLRARLEREGRLAPDEALRIARGVAAALDYAHRHCVVHRDVKPENILLGEGGALVADFGIAKAVSAAGDEALTQSGLALGTPAYMSPEQVAGEADVDGRSDTYALACVTYEMLSGEPPFTGPTAQAVMAKRFTQTAPDLRRVAGTTPEAVAQALARAMARRPDDRFATAGEFASALVLTTVTPPQPRAAVAKSIAVLAFANMSTDAENEYFSDGISEEIINALTKLPMLRVASRTSAFAFKEKHEDVRVIGERLNVAVVLEGSVRRAGARLRITAQLIDVSDGYHLWSETYDRELHDVFAIQDEIARAIVDTLRIKLLGDPDAALVVKPTESVDAYALYLKGRYYWAKRTEPALRKGIAYFEEATAKDPAFALAHVGLADSYNILGFQDLMPPRSAFARAHEGARRALAMDATLAAAHAAEAYALLYFDWDWEGAERGFKRAIELGPRYPTAPFYYANLLQFKGRTEEAIVMYTRALELDPLALIVIAAVGQIRHLNRRYEEAIGHYRAALELDGDFLFARFWMGMNYAAMGRFAEAQAELERTVALTDRGHPTMLAGLARVHALAGRAAEARALLAELADAAQHRFISSYELATVHSALGDQERALSLLEEAYDEKSHSMTLLAQDPRLDSLRGDARFTALREKVRI